MSRPKAIVRHGKRDTIVALLGWAGAVDRNVEKYAGIYQKKGYTTVQFTALAAVKGWGTKDGRNVDHLASTLDSVLINPSNRLVFHVFSMNGFIALTSLDSQFPELKAIEKCDGIFMDSCPACFSFSIENMQKHALVMNHVYVSIAFSFGMIMGTSTNGFELYSTLEWVNVEKSLSLTKMKLRAISIFQIKNSNFVLGNFYKVYKKWETARFGYQMIMDTMSIKAGLCTIEEANPFFYLLNHPHLPPILTSIFSDNDIVCSADEINLFNECAAKKSDKKRQIMATRLKDTAHVEHFRKYPKLYLEKMDEFLQKVEKLRNGGNSKL